MVGMSEVVLLFTFLIPAISIFLMYLHERCKENMIALYADMQKICDLPDDHTTISLDEKNAVTIKGGTPSIESFGEPWFDSPKYPSGSSHRSHRTNCRNCAAPLPKDGKCIFCGTNNDMEVPEEQSNARSEMKITPSSITFTCEPVRQSYQYESAATRDVYGRLHRKVINYNE